MGFLKVRSSIDLGPTSASLCRLISPQLADFTTLSRSNAFTRKLVHFNGLSAFLMRRLNKLKEAFLIYPFQNKCSLLSNHSNKNTNIHLLRTKPAERICMYLLTVVGRNDSGAKSCLKWVIRFLGWLSVPDVLGLI